MFITLLFTLFFVPYSIDFGSDGISANYSFILFPGLIWFLSKKIYLPHQNIRLIIYTYMMIFVVACVYQYPYYQFADRRMAAFIIFMSIFSYTTIKINEDLICCFKASITLISILLSLQTISSYFLLGGADLGYDAKGAVGSQRFGFVYIMAIWITYYYLPTKKLVSIFKYVIIFILLSGLMLTFSRSGIVAILGSSLIFITVKVMSNITIKKLLGKKFLAYFVLSIFIIGILYLVLSTLFPVVFDFFGDRLFSLETSSGSQTYDFENPEASEGWRVYMMKIIGEFVLFNPFTGSGYLGSWILFDDLSGSAHNQYLDVFFRTGIIGFSAYLWMLYRLLGFLKINEPSLFWGLVGVLIYGLFHETFKLSQGGFILSFMLGMLAQKLRDNVAHVQYKAVNSHGSSESTGNSIKEVKN